MSKKKKSKKAAKSGSTGNGAAIAASDSTGMANAAGYPAATGYGQPMTTPGAVAMPGTAAPFGQPGDMAAAAAAAAAAGGGGGAGMGAHPGMMGANPMVAQMMQMMQQMMLMTGGGGFGSLAVDEAAQPFRSAVEEEQDAGLRAELIRPAHINPLRREQQALPAQAVLDVLCVREDGGPLGGLPYGCTIAFVGPPGKGKSRTCLEALARLAAAGARVGYIVAEEGFRDPQPGRDDLCSRMTKIGAAALGMSDDQFAQTVLTNVVVLEATYHKGWSWDEFIARYRTMVEREQCTVMIVDSLNMLDPSKRRTADNLSTLKTYNHAHGVTCLTVGQIKDTGDPQGGEALVHTADCVFLIEEMSLGSKEIAQFWGGNYRDKIDVIRAVKSVTTRTFPHPIRLARDPATGSLAVHPDQPGEYAVPGHAAGAGTGTP